MKKLYSIVVLALILTGCQSPTDLSSVDSNEPGMPVQEETNQNMPNTDLNSNSNSMTFNQTDLPQEGDKLVTMETSMGTIKIRLFADKTPKTVENFIGLAAKQYYNGIIFHRVIPDFMIQGGDPTGTGMGGESLWGAPFEDEFVPELKNLRGALSMANAGPGTNGSQFFIVQKQGGTPWLDGHHTVFGQVYEGMDVVDAIAAVETDPMDKPLQEIKIVSLTVE